VLITKQPLGIGFLATGAFEGARDSQPDVAGWIVAGHSLGGTVASMDAEAHAAGVESDRPVVGLLLHASYPASDLSEMAGVAVLSVSGTNDGLATPADIEASRADLPADAGFEAIEGAVHSFFGDYGPQPGDGEPTISHDEARTRISNASVGFAAQQATSQ
jgi:dienelactone hydrolase